MHPTSLPVSSTRRNFPLCSSSRTLFGLVRSPSLKNLSGRNAAFTKRAMASASSSFATRVFMDWLCTGEEACAHTSRCAYMLIHVWKLWLSWWNVADWNSFFDERQVVRNSDFNVAIRHEFVSVA